MEGLENATVTPSVAPQVTPMVNPTPTAAPVSAPTPTPSVEPTFNDSSDNSLMGIIKSLNWIEITFGVLGAAALYYTIYYYKYNLTNGDKARNEMQNRIDALEIKLAELKEEEENKNTATPLF
jgi:hypothetical protein